MPPDAQPGTRPVTACTVVARNYLPAARVLARSYLRHHPGHEFVIAVVDAEPTDVAAEADGVRIVAPASFGIDEQDYLRMATAYSVTELATAVKPYVLRELRAAAPDGVVLYLDPDIVVYAPMPELVDLAADHAIVLTPHFLEPMPRDGHEPDEAVIMGTGVFNLGFLATGPGSEEFLDFWARRLRHDAIVAPHEQLFTDQRWVDQVPALFGHHVLRDPGFNVAYWNLHERTVTVDGDGYRVDGHPLRFFHFSGYRPERPWLLSYHCARRPRILLSDHPVLRQLCDGYGTALREAGYAETLDAIPYGFATMADGTALTTRIRRLFRAAWVRAEHPDDRRQPRESVPPHAFGPDGGQQLRAWLTAPADAAQAAAGLHRLAMAVWEARTDLQLVYPRPCGPDGEGFRHWCAGSGGAEGELPAWAVPADPSRPQPPVEEFGVNLAGYLTAELGLGEMGRIVHDAVTAAGIDVVSVVEERSLSNRTGIDHAGDRGRPRFGVSILAVNADQTPVILANYPEIAHERYTIGLWAWELEDFPEWQHAAFDHVDEVWTPSDFCSEAVAAHATVPVHTIPVPVRDPGEPAPRSRRSGDPVTFLFAFDFNSVGERKNPWGVLTAFRRAFGDRTDVRLVLKAINGDVNPHTAERLRVLVADDDRIELIERYVSVSELDDLYAAADCYVSLHRSEGFGLTVAEAMARALPVIATDYSSTTEFFDERCGWPIPYRMVSVGEGNFPYQADAVWADPDCDAAAEAMRAVADDPAEAARRGRAAREHVLRSRPQAAASAWLRERLQAAYHTWQERRRAHVAEPVDPLQPLHAGRQALQWRTDASAPARLPLAPAMRKAVLRAIDHYDVHQRHVLGTVVDGTEETVARLLARIEALEARQDATDTALTDTVHARVEQLTRPALRRTARTADDVRELGEDVRTIAAELRADISAVRTTAEEAAAALPESAARTDLEKVVERLHNHERWTQETLQHRDARIDSDERTLQAVQRDIAAVHDAARMLHAPVPDGADVVLCDAGALLLTADSVVWRWISHHRWWERAEAQLLAQLMRRRGGVFLDIGAHVGYHSLRLARACPDLAGVVAVEADPVNFDHLQRNIAANLPDGIRARVHTLPVAAWDADGVVELVHADPTNSGDHRGRALPSNGGAGDASAADGGDPAVDAGDPAADAGGPVSDGRALTNGDAGAATPGEVPSVRLDHVPEVVAATIGVVKLDLQGRDHRALAGMRDVIARDRPAVVCEFCPEAIEELGDDPATVLEAYRGYGYTPAVLSDDGAVSAADNDDELIARARADETGFVTLCLTPAGP